VSALFVLMGWAVSHLTLEEDISSFLPTDQNEQVQSVYRHISTGGDIFVSFSLHDTTATDGEESLIESADQFVSVLQKKADPQLIRSITYKVNADQALNMTDFITNNIPYFLTDEDYDTLEMRLADPHRILLEDYQNLSSPLGMALTGDFQKDPFHFSTPVLQRLKDMKMGSYDIYDDCIFTSDHRHLLLFIESANGGSETARNALLAKAIDEAAQAVSHQVDVRYFGAPLVAVSNASQLKTDMLKSIALTATIILLFLIFFFKDFRPLFYVTVSVAFGALFGLSLMTLFKGGVSTIALSAGSVIVGIAINYALHFVIHLQHDGDARSVVRDIADPMTTGNVTTVGAFLALLLISAQAMRDLGLFAALSLLGTILFVLIVLPHWAKAKPKTKLHCAIDRRMDVGFEKNGKLIAVTVLVTIVLAFFSNKVQFDTDFSHINYMTDSQRKALAEMKQITNIGDKTVYQITSGRTLNEALDHQALQTLQLKQLQKRGDVKLFTDQWSLLPSEKQQTERLRRWNEFKQKQGARLIEAAQNPMAYGFAPHAFDDFVALMNRPFTVQRADFFNPIRNNLLNKSIIAERGSVILVNRVTVKDGKAHAVYDSFSKQKNAFLIDTQTLTEKLVDTLSNDFNWVLWVSGLLVFFYLWFSYGRIELTGIAFLPMAVSWLWILGFMALTGIKFNIVNIILSTFIFGLGDDYTIFIVDGLMYEYAYGRRQMLSTYKTSVFLSALMMLVGIGSLILAVHPALRSLAIITIIGMTCVVFIAFTVTPSVFRWMTMHKGQRRMMPFTWSNLLLTVYSFIVGAICCLCMTAVGFYLFKLHKVTERRKRMYHRLMQRGFQVVLQLLPGVKHRYQNCTADMFTHPQIIIANHQSHLDLMYILSLSPKIIAVTNAWAWNNPLYSHTIHWADFFPITEFGPDSVARFRQAMDQGYSVLIFPEGTRTLDGHIGRFHKGAFYLAQQLQCAIQPVLLHGVDHVLPKAEFVLRQGMVTIEALPSIPYEPKDDLLDWSKQVRHAMINAYEQLCVTCEDVAYYRQDVLASYRYKGKDTEHEARLQISDATVLNSYVRSLPAGELRMEHCGVGARALMTALLRPDIKILATDDDKDKIQLASQIAIIPPNLYYE
jgi:uncharacterized protein